MVELEREAERGGKDVFENSRRRTHSEGRSNTWRGSRSDGWWGCEEREGTAGRDEMRAGETEDGRSRRKKKRRKTRRIGVR